MVSPDHGRQCKQLMDLMREANPLLRKQGLGGMSSYIHRQRSSRKSLRKIAANIIVAYSRVSKTTTVNKETVTELVSLLTKAPVNFDVLDKIGPLETCKGLWTNSLGLKIISSWKL